MRDRRHAKTCQELAKFQVGDRVKFEASDGQSKEGEVLRVSKKTVTVCCGGQHWRVSPALLQRVDGAERESLFPNADEESKDSDGEPSQQGLDRSRKQVEAWWNDFEKSLLYKGLNDVQRAEGHNIVTALADFMHDFAGYKPAHWTDSALHEICVDIMPRKIMAGEGFFAAVSPVLTAFFGFLADKGYQKNALGLARCVSAMGGDIMRSANNRDNWGPGKALLANAQQAGVDITNRASLQEFILRQNAGLAAALRLGAEAQNTSKIPAFGKAGRNDACPCGSGKKFKKCCASGAKLAHVSH